MNNYTIYMHKNKINGKIYIGQTCQKPEYRQNNGKGYVNCSYFYRAIQKYGQDNFEHIILFNNLSKQEANIKEKELIKKFNSNDEKFGYNIQAGGENHTFSKLGKEHCKQSLIKTQQNEEYKENMSKKMKEKQENDNKYKEKVKEGLEKARIEHYKKTGSKNFLTEEGRNKISEARKKYIAEHGTPTQGKGHTEEAKEKIRQAKLGEKNPMYGKHHTEEQKKQVAMKVSTPVRCIETSQIFSSKKEAALQCGLSSGSGITDQIAGRRKSAGKHPETGEKLHWENV